MSIQVGGKIFSYGNDLNMPSEPGTLATQEWVTANAGSGSVTIGGVYDSNAAAVAALGVGKLYKSSTQINGSPIILITV